MPLDEFRPRADDGARAERYLAEGLWTDETLGTILAAGFAEAPDEIASFRSDVRPWKGTFAESADRARRVAGGLLAAGVKAGEPVAFQIPNWPEAAWLFWAIAFIGAVPVPIVHFYGPKEVEFILRQSGARFLVTADRFGHLDFVGNLETLRPTLPTLEQVWVVGDAVPGDAQSYDVLLDGDPIDGPLQTDPSAPALIAYTSGTTADPKGVVHSHRTINFEIRQLSGLDANRGRPVLVGAPVGHGIGLLAALLMPVHRRESLYLIDVWDPGRVLAGMLEDDISSGSGSTYFLTSLFDHPDFSAEHAAKMPRIGLGGSPVPAAVGERAERLGISTVRSFGSTEHPSITGLPARDATREAAQHRRRADARRRDRAARRGRLASSSPACRGRSGARGPTASSGTPTRSSRRSASTPTAGSAPATSACATRTASSRSSTARRTSSSAAARTSAPPRWRSSSSACRASPRSRSSPRPTSGSASTAARSSACSPTGARPPTSTQVREQLAAAGLAKQKWPEDVRPIEEFPRTPSGKIQKFVLRQRLRDE